MYFNNKEQGTCRTSHLDLLRTKHTFCSVHHSLVISWLSILLACHMFSCYSGTWLLDLDCHVLLSLHLFNRCLLNCPRPHFCSKFSFPQSEAFRRHPFHLAALLLTSPVFKKWNVISLLALLLLKADINSIQVSRERDSSP